MAKLMPLTIEQSNGLKDVFNFPSHWSVENSQFAFDEVRDGTHDSPKESSTGVPLVTSKNLRSGYIDFNNTKTISFADHEEISKRSAVREGDILFSMIGTIGSVAIVSGNKNFSVKNVGLFRKNPHLLNEKYAFYWLQSKAYRKYLDERKRGGNQKFVSLGVLRESPIPIAPLNEQIRIANKLDSLLAKVDAAQARLEKIPTLLKRFRQSVLAAATSGELTREWRQNNECESAKKNLDAINTARQEILNLEISGGKKESIRLKKKISQHSFEPPNEAIPGGWVWTSFMGCMERVVDCHNKTAPYIDSGIPLIRTTDIRNGKISLSGAKYISQETYAFWSKRCPPTEGDIIFTREAPMGEAGIVPLGVTLCMGQRMMLLRPVSEYMNAKYVLFNIMSPAFQSRMNDQAIGTGVKHLRVSDVESLAFPLAPQAEQKEIVRRVESLFALADTVEKQYHEAKKRTDRLTQSLLAKAFRGELVPQDPKDEPASELLKRIQAERESQAAKKPKRKSSERKASSAPKADKPNKAPIMKLADASETYLIDLLNQLGGEADAKALWDKSELSIDDFYAKLKQEMQRGEIIDDKSSSDPAFRKLKLATKAA